MRRFSFTIPAIVLGLLSLAPVADAQSTVSGFGGLAVNGGATQSVFGGNVAVDLAPNIQAIGEVGRMNDVLPSLASRLIALTPIDLRVTAWYGEGGIRFVTGRHSPVRGYVDATGGFARLSTNFAGAGSIDPFVDAALRFFDRTSPMLGVGGGVLFGNGPVVVDLGYRYKKIFGGNVIDQVLSGGNDIGISQVRAGIGVRF